MIGARIRLEVKPLLALADTVQRSPTTVRARYARRVKPLMDKLLAALKDEPGKPHYPLKWKNKRQKRKVMRLLRLADNLPYERQHELIKLWKPIFRPVGTGGRVEFNNVSPVMEYVQGEWQQPFHDETGWAVVDDLLVRARPEAETLLVQSWFSVIDDTGGA